jgi:invasion protein IalB
VIRTLTAAIVTAFVGLPSLAPAQTAQEPTRQQVGDWTVICAPAGRPCVMEQIGKTAQGEDALSMQIEKLPEPQTVDGQQIESVGNFLVPLGVLLQAGLRLRVDSGETAASPYFLCQQNGCVVRAPLQPELLDRFRRGARATLTFAALDNGQPRDVEISLSLSGFTRAYNTLP